MKMISPELCKRKNLPDSEPARVMTYLEILRPYQWLKNLLVFTPVFFAGKITDLLLLRSATGAALMFCATASFGYLLNDWLDRKRDANHPQKCRRPIPAGKFNNKDLLLLGAFLIFLIFFLSFYFRPDTNLSICLVVYLLLSLAYSFRLKNIACFEIYLIATFFVIRVLAGGLATGIHISSWLFATVFFLSLLITLAKRKNEIVTMGEDAQNHRVSLKHYPVVYLDHFLWAMAGVSIVTYALYTVENNQNLVYSIVPATYGVTRFLLVTEQGKGGGDPIVTLAKDYHLISATLVFLGLICLKIYG